MDSDRSDIADMPGLEGVLKQHLSKSDAEVSRTRPILKHLLSTRDHSIFSDEILAKVRGMLAHVARQLLFSRAEEAYRNNPSRFSDPAQFALRHEAELTALLQEDGAFLTHAHTVAIEMQLIEQLQRRSGFDAVVSPLIKELSASSDATMATLAMQVLSAQARFVQQQRRMELPLGELPGELFHQAILLMLGHAGESEDAKGAADTLRSDFGDKRSRIARITDLIRAMGHGAQRSLAVDNAGFSMFATALGLATSMDRSLAIYAFGENQAVRLALALRAAGLKKPQIEEQFLFLHPDVSLPGGIEGISSAQAASILANVTQDEPG